MEKVIQNGAQFRRIAGFKRLLFALEIAQSPDGPALKCVQETERS